MYKIKEKPEDFVVEEILNLQFLQEPAKYIVYKLKKTGLNTIQVVDMLTKHLRLKQNDVGYAGIKDRHAITTQYISIPVIPNKISKDTIEAFKCNGVELTHMGYSHKHICSPMIVGNEFTLTIQDCRDYKITPQTKMINYFGEQRFSKNNADIGYALIKKDFQKATELLLAYAHDENKRTYNEKKVIEWLKKSPTDHIGALRQLPGKTTTFYIHAYQSKLWNQTISELLQKQNVKGIVDEEIFAYIPEAVPPVFPPKVPAIGFFYDENDWDETITKVVDSLFQRDKITERDFVIKQMSEATEMGAVRNTIVPITDLTINKESDDVLKITFTLERGCYATMALRHLLTKK